MKTINFKTIILLSAMIGIISLMSNLQCHAEIVTIPLQDHCVSIDFSENDAYLLNDKSEVLRVSAEGEVSRILVNLDIDRTEPEYSQAEDLAIFADKIIFVMGNSQALQIADLKKPGERAKPLLPPGLEADDRPIRLTRCGDNLLVETLNGVKKLFEVKQNQLLEIAEYQGILAGSNENEPLRIELSGPPENLSNWKIIKGNSNEAVFAVLSAQKTENVQDLRVLGQDKSHRLYCLVTQGPAEQNTTTWLITARSGKEVGREKFFAPTMQEMAKSDAVTGSGIVFAVRKNSDNRKEGWGNLYIRTPTDQVE